jgi:hypothetical protein
MICVLAFLLPYTTAAATAFPADGEQVCCALVDSLRVVDRQSLLSAGDGDTAAAAALLSRIYGQQRRTKRRDAILHGLLRAGAERDYRDHRAHADHDAEHRE